MLAKNSLALAKQGYELMDKKRNILIRELMNLIEEAKTIQTQIDTTFTEAYQALQQANIEVGIHYVQQIAQAIPVENGVRIKTRSIMGTEIPLVEHEEEKRVPYYGFYNSSESVDAAREGFLKVKELTLKLSMVENSAYRLAMNIRKTQKRANALKNITIPSYTALVKDITNALDEKDIQRRTQTALEQVSANQAFRDIANFFRSIEYRHILPQAVRDPQGFSAVPVMNDPYGRDIVRQIWATPHKTREARLRRIDKALQIAVPTLTELKVEMDENLGQPHLRAKFQHWRPNGAIQDESSFSDGTLRLIALFWMLLEKGGPLLLEEPESSLNEDIVRCLASLFGKFALSKQGRQIIVSTHSYALLDDPGIQPEEMLKLESGKAGAVVQPLSDDSVQLMKNGLTAAEAAFPEIRHSNCFTFLLSSQFHV